jgi:hypothetical protein
VYFFTIRAGLARAKLASVVAKNGTYTASFTDHRGQPRWVAMDREGGDRHDGRPTLGVGDEYDVQDLLHALLRLFFDDIRPEERTPSYAGESTRMDFGRRRRAGTSSAARRTGCAGTRRPPSRLRSGRSPVGEGGADRGSRAPRRAPKRRRDVKAPPFPVAAMGSRPSDENWLRNVDA